MVEGIQVSFKTIVPARVKSVKASLQVSIFYKGKKKHKAPILL